MSLGENKFEENDEVGWPSLVREPGCELAVADLIRRYRIAHGIGMNSQNILLWEEGKLRVFGGEIEDGIKLILASKRDDDNVWNAYVDATVAFLRRDRNELSAARERLASIPEPPGFAKAAARLQAKTGRSIFWPPNLDIVDGLVACFDQPYFKAYQSKKCMGK